MEKFSEATVGYRQNKEAAERWVQLFSTPYFIVTAVSLAHPFLTGNKLGKNLLQTIFNEGLTKTLDYVWKGWGGRNLPILLQVCLEEIQEKRVKCKEGTWHEWHTFLFPSFVQLFQQPN